MICSSMSRFFIVQLPLRGDWTPDRHVAVFRGQRSLSSEGPLGRASADEFLRIYHLSSAGSGAFVRGAGVAAVSLLCGGRLVSRAGRVVAD
jgi:hypothetical protein